MNKICKIYMGVAMVTSILIFLFGLYFSTKGIVEVTYESWRAMGVSCLAFLLALFSMMKLPFKIKQRILGLELMFITVLFAPMILKGTIPNFQLSPFVVIADITIVYTVVGLMILWMNNRRGHQGKLQDGFTVLLMTETKFGIILKLENNTNPFELLGNCRSCQENWMNRGHEKTRLCLEHENKITFYLLFHCS